MNSARLPATSGIFTCALRKGIFIPLLLFAGVYCSSFSRYTSIGNSYPVIPPPRSDFKKIRIVVLPFRNSARLKSFDVIPDGNYRGLAYGPYVMKSAREMEKTNPEPAPATTSPEKNTIVKNVKKKTRENVPAPAELNAGLVARETLETTLFSAGRFEIVPYALYLEKLKKLEKENPNDPLNRLKAARLLNIVYIVQGDLTNFEIRRKKSYWKVPLWAILLVGALAVRHKETRNFALEMLARGMLNPGINSFLRRKGVQWDRTKLQVDVGLNMRLIDSRGGSVAYSIARNTTRTDTASNINLLIWSSSKRVKITRSNAGRQIRYTAYHLTKELALWADKLR